MQNSKGLNGTQGSLAMLFTLVPWRGSAGDTGSAVRADRWMSPRPPRGGRAVGTTTPRRPRAGLARPRDCAPGVTIATAAGRTRSLET